MADRRSRRDIAVAGLAGAVFAVVVILASSGGDFDRMTFGDGELHRAVAQDLGADESTVDPAIAGSGPAVRYGRIGFPALLWTFSAGSPDAMGYLQPALMVASASGIAIATLLVLGPPSIAWAMVPFFGVGLTVALAGGFAEPWAILLGLAGLLLVERRRSIAAALCFAGAMITRESAVVVFVGAALWLLKDRRWRDVFIVTTSLLPVAAWHLVVAQRFGHLPLGDPWLNETDTVGAPIAAIVQALPRLTASSVVVLVVHVALIVVALRFARSSALGLVAAIGGLAMLNVGYNTWRYIGDAVRVAAFFEVFLVLSIARRWLDTRIGRPSVVD